MHPHCNTCAHCTLCNESANALQIWGSVSAPGTHRTSFFDHSPLVPVFAPTSTNNLEYFLAVSKMAHLLHPVYDNGKGGNWKWWE